MVELLPCPFCGGPAIVAPMFALGSPKIFAVHCDDCSAGGPVDEESVTEAVAIELWNRRVSDEVMTRLIATLARFELMGKQNEECAEYVLSVLDYIMSDARDDPTEDWLKYPYG